MGGIAIVISLLYFMGLLILCIYLLHKKCYDEGSWADISINV